MKTTELVFKVTVDENNLPLNIQWETPGSGEKSECKSVMIALWDSKENNTLRIDLWTKDMMVDEMADFFYQTFMGMADSYNRATHNEEMVNDIRTFAKGFYKKFRDQQLQENKG